MTGSSTQDVPCSVSQSEAGYGTNIGRRVGRIIRHGARSMYTCYWIQGGLEGTGWTLPHRSKIQKEPRGGRPGHRGAR
eukprot:531143-Rhodomonas_salina.2